MGSERRMYRCGACGRHTEHLRNKPRHLLHFVVCFFTGGLWVFGWLYVTFIGSPARCTECGSRRGLFG